MKQIPPRVFVSSDFSQLREKLAQTLYRSSSKPFAKKLILIPDLQQKNELLTYFLKQFGIVMGFDFMKLEKGIQFIFKELTGQSFEILPPSLMALYLQAQFKKCPQLAAYRDKETTKKEGLASAIAFLFASYAKYGNNALEIWKKEKGWQQTLYHDLISNWDSFSKLLKTPFIKHPAFLEIHLFKFSYLPPIYHLFFQKVSHLYQVYYYQFSPCKEFWTDIFSEKERLWVEKKVDSKSKKAFVASLEESPFLLAQFGSLLKKNFRFFEDNDFIIEEAYKSKEEEKLLHHIQNDILLFKAPTQGKKIEIKKDDSIEIFGAISKLREIEILYERLLFLTQKETIRFSEIRIYAPDISTYAPFISFIFGAKTSLFPFIIFDLPLMEDQGLIEAFFCLLSLSKEKFTIESLLRLFSYMPFKKRFNFKDNQIDFLRKWLEKGGVTWGTNSCQRAFFLNKKDPEKIHDIGTFENTFKRTLKHFAKLPKEKTPWPELIYDFSDSELIGKGIAIIRRLEKKITFLEKNNLPLNEWGDYLRSLLTYYFHIDDAEKEAYKLILEKIENLEKLSKKIPSTPFSFSSIYRYLKESLNQRKASQKEVPIEKLHFASLKLGAIDHAKVICLIGMDESSFPRLSSQSSLKKLKLKEEPTLQEEDRSLFLEALFGASSHFILSYVNTSEEDRKETLPSSLVQEFFSYLDRSYSIEGEKSSKALMHVTPSFSFHKSYFENQNKSSSMQNYRASCLFYGKEASSFPFIPEFLYPPSFSHSSEGKTLLDIKHLHQFALHPLRFYFNHKLELYLDYKKQDETYVLSPLNKKILQQISLKESFEKAFEMAEKKGKLPTGRFKEVAYLVSHEETKVLEENLKSLLGSKENLFSLTLNPPLKITLLKNREFLISGTLSQIAKEGFIFYGEKKWKDFLKIYPLFLVFCVVALPLKKELLLIKTKERLSLSSFDPIEALSSYLLYFEYATSSPSPAIPLLFEALIKKQESLLSKLIKETTDPYVKWAFHPEGYSMNVLLDFWAPLCQKTFAPLIKILGE